MSVRQIDRRVSTGRWLVITPGVYLAADHEFSEEARVRAAALWAGEPSTISGVAAAWWHGLWPELPPVVEVTVPVRRCLAARTGIRVRRRDLSEHDRVGVRGLWVTDVPLTVLEAAVAVGEHGQRLLDQALQRRVRYATLHRAHCRNAGRRGATKAGQLLDVAADRAASAAERKLVRLLRAAGLTGWRQHYRHSGYELDFAFPDPQVAVEVDGWAWHHDAGTFGRDRARQNSLVLAGWSVLRFTWRDLAHRPSEVIHQIRAAIGDDRKL